MCKAHTDQSMYKLYTTSEKKELTSPQTAKNLFSNMYVIDTTCFENVFYSIWGLGIIVFYKVYSITEVFSTAMLLRTDLQMVLT